MCLICPKSPQIRGELWPDHSSPALLYLLLIFRFSGPRPVFSDFIHSSYLETAIMKIYLFSTRRNLRFSTISFNLEQGIFLPHLTLLCQEVFWMQKISSLHLVILLPVAVRSRNWKKYCPLSWKILTEDEFCRDWAEIVKRAF